MSSIPWLIVATTTLFIVNKGKKQKQCKCPMIYDAVCCVNKDTNEANEYSSICVAACFDQNISLCIKGTCPEIDGGCLNDYNPICCSKNDDFPNECIARYHRIDDIDNCKQGRCDDQFCECDLEYDPICCSGKDYVNKCVAECQGVGIDALSSCLSGECSKQSNFGGCPLKYDPICCDGKIYANKCDAHWNKKHNKDCTKCPFGKYSLHGGNMENQQISLNSIITEENIDNLHEECLFASIDPNGFAFTGYVTVDDEEHGYVSDTSGYIKCFDVKTCSLIWKTNIADIVNETGMASRNTLSLFQTKSGKSGLLFGTPNQITEIDGIILRTTIWTCWVIALDIDNGNLMWKTAISDIGSCLIHGVQIDNDGYAYGGTSSFWNNFPPDADNIHIGKVFKIDINTGELINEWYTLPSVEDQTDNINDDLYYSGASIWPIMSIIDKWFVFGTGNLYTYPKRVEQCMLGNINEIPEGDTRPYNPCDEKQLDVLHWRCFEDINIYPTSLIILNKKTFKIKSSIPFYGVDIWSNFCSHLSEEQIQQIPECPKSFNGPDADSVAVASYRFNNKLYAAVGQKSGQFYIVKIPNGELKVSKKIGPWGVNGGLAPFSMAVDEHNLIAIASYRGASRPSYRYTMADGTIICDGGSIHAIDLATGWTMWQWINPYSKTGIDECNGIEYDEYVDPTTSGMCERSFDGSEMLSPNITIPYYDGNVVTPPINQLIEPISASTRAMNVGPVTLSNNMVFIPTMTGEVFVHNIFNGEYIKRLQCPDFIFNNTSNRQGIRSGITLYDNKLMFYCGARDFFFSNAEDGASNGQIVVMGL